MPSFIIWRWAGRALDGWIRCRWITLLLQAPVPLLHPRSMAATSRHPVPGQHARGRRLPERAGPESLPPGNQPAASPAAGSPPRRRAGNQLNGQRRRVPRSRRANRPPGSRPREAAAGAQSVRGANRPRRAAAGVAKRGQLLASSAAMAAAQLIRAIWVNACGKLPRNTPVAGSISSE